MKNAPHEGRFFLVPIMKDYRELCGLLSLDPPLFVLVNRVIDEL